MFGVVPRVLWEREQPPDELNRILLTLRVMLIQDGARRILIDAGIGDYQGQVLAERYEIKNAAGGFEELLAPFGTDPESITDVVATHLHFDHIGGLFKRVKGTLVPTFVQARIWVQQQQWDWARSRCVKDRGSYQQGCLEALEGSGQIGYAAGPVEVTASVRVLLCQGHTPAMQTVLVRTDEGACFYAADLVPTASHVKPAWNMSYDNNPLETIAEKQHLLSRAAAEGWTIYFEHDPTYEKGHVRAKDGGFVFLSPPA